MSVGRVTLSPVQVGGRAGRHGARVSVRGMPGGDAPFGALGERVGELGDLEDVALAAVSAEDVREVLRVGPPELQRAVLDIVRLGGARRSPPGRSSRCCAPCGTATSGAGAAAAAPRRHLRAQLRERRRTGCGRLRAAARRGHGGEVLERASLLRSLLGWDLPTAFVRWGWSGSSWTTVRSRWWRSDCWRRSRWSGCPARGPCGRRSGEHPELPERPVDVLELRAIAAGEREEVPPEPEQLASELDELRGRFVPAADAAERIAGHLRDGQRPDDSDLVLVQCVAADFDGLAMRILPAEQPVELDELDAVVQAMLEADRRDDRVRALRYIEGRSPRPNCWRRCGRPRTPGTTIWTCSPSSSRCARRIGCAPPPWWSGPARSCRSAGTASSTSR